MAKRSDAAALASRGARPGAFLLLEQWFGLRANFIPLALLLVFPACLPANAAQLKELPQPANSPDTASAEKSPECKATPSSNGKCKCCDVPGKTTTDMPVATELMKPTPRIEKFGSEPWPGQKNKAGSRRPLSVVPV